MFFEQFGLLFSNMEWFVAVLVSVGFVLLLLEILTPGFGAFGISGLILNIAAIIFRAIFHKDNDNVVMQIFIFILFDILVIAFFILVVFILWKCKVLKKSPFFLSSTAVNKDRSDATKDLSFLLNKEGETFTLMRPSGKILVDGKIYDAESNGVVIEKGTKIKVVAYIDSILRIEKISEEINEEK